MRLVAFVLLASVTGCMSLDGLSDSEPAPPAAATHDAPSTGTAPTPTLPAKPPTPTRCDPASPFTSVVALDAPDNTNVFAARWDANKTTVIFNAAVGIKVEIRLGMTFADGTNAPFGPILPQESAIQPTMLFPTLSDDGLVLFYQVFTPNQNDPHNGVSTIWRARRSNTDHAFHDAQPVFPLSQMDFAPYLVKSSLYFTHQDVTNRSSHVVRWTLDGTADPTDVLVSQASSLSGAVVSDDELTLYYADARGGSFDVFVARRATTKEPFTSGTRIDALSTPTKDELPSWISNDECELVFEKSDSSQGTHSTWSARRLKPASSAP